MFPRIFFSSVFEQQRHRCYSNAELNTIYAEALRCRRLARVTTLGQSYSESGRHCISTLCSVFDARFRFVLCINWQQSGACRFRCCKYVVYISTDEHGACRFRCCKYVVYISTDGRGASIASRLFSLFVHDSGILKRHLLRFFKDGPLHSYSVSVYATC